MKKIVGYLLVTLLLLGSTVLQAHESYKEWLKDNKDKPKEEIWEAMNSFKPIFIPLLRAFGYDFPKQPLFKDEFGAGYKAKDNLVFRITGALIIGRGTVIESGVKPIKGFRFFQKRYGIKIDNTLFGQKLLSLFKEQGYIIIRTTGGSIKSSAPHFPWPLKVGDRIVFFLYSRKNKTGHEPFYFASVSIILPHREHNEVLYDWGSNIHKNHRTYPYRKFLELLKKEIVIGNALRVKEGLKPLK